MSRSRASKLLARPPRSLNSARIPMKTQRVIITGSALGTTRVMIADSTVVATISAPTTKASTASRVVSTASLPPLAPVYSPWRRAAARALAASPGRPRGAPTGTQPRGPPAPGRPPHPTQQPAPPLRTVRVGVAAGGDAGLGQHRPNLGSQLGGPEIPQPPPRRPRWQAPRPLVHPRIIPATRWGGRPGGP